MYHLLFQSPSALPASCVTGNCPVMSNLPNRQLLLLNSIQSPRQTLANQPVEQSTAHHHHHRSSRCSIDSKWRWEISEKIKSVHNGKWMRTKSTHNFSSVRPSAAIKLPVTLCSGTSTQFSRLGSCFWSGRLHQCLSFSLSGVYTLQ